MAWGIETPQSSAIISCQIRQPSYSISPGVPVTYIIVNDKVALALSLECLRIHRLRYSSNFLAENVKCILKWWGLLGSLVSPSLLFYLVLSAKERVPPTGCGIHRNVFTLIKGWFKQSNCVGKTSKECLTFIIIIIAYICLITFIINKHWVEIILEIPCKYLEIKIPICCLTL